MLDGHPCRLLLPCQKHILALEEEGLKGEAQPETLRKLMLRYSIFENYISPFHAGLIDKGNWSFTGSDVDALRRAVLHAYHISADGPATSGGATVKVYVYTEEEVPELSPLLR